MVNGPPTPPPTTEAEILDEERSNTQVQPITQPAASTSTITSTTQYSADSYYRLLPSLENQANQGNFSELARVAEDGDLNGENDKVPDRFIVTGPLVLAYLITDETSSARHALARLPENLADQPLSQALSTLLASVWSRKYGQVYSRAESLFNLVQLPDFFNSQLGSLLARMTEFFVDSFRRRTFALLCKAYTSIPLALAQSYMGLPTEQLIAVLANEQFSYDANAQVLRPLVTPTSLPLKTAMPSSVTTFHLVADGVARLET